MAVLQLEGGIEMRSHGDAVEVAKEAEMVRDEGGNEKKLNRSKEQNCSTIKESQVCRHIKIILKINKDANNFKTI